MFMNIGKLALSSLLIFSSGFLWAQDYEGQVDASLAPKLSGHFEPEYTFDVSTAPERWKSGQDGLHVSFASINALYFRADVPVLPKVTKSFTKTGWRGDRINAQILVWSADTLEQVRFKVEDLKSDKGAIINKDQVSLNIVRYVLSNYPYGAKDVVCGDSPYKNTYLMPDRFESFERFDVPGKTVRPVWVSLNIPPGTQPGVYKGILEVQAKGYKEKLELQVNVQDQLLPEPYEWKHRLDLWQNPWVPAWYYHLEPWSEEHKALLKKHLKLYADAGGKYITTYAVHSPWADNSYMIEGGMIDWVLKSNGSWDFNYKIFDEYVELAMSVGIDKAITIYTPVPWGYRFRYMDEKTGDYVYESWAPDSEKFKSFWNVFLSDLQKHLEQKGWFDKTYLGINENPLDQTLAAIKVINEHSQRWKITYAGDWHPELDSLLDDYSYLYGKESDITRIKGRSARGATTTYYVCCNPPKPNNFVFSPPIEGRWISWYSAALGYDGFLRWAYDAWPADPVRDARHGSWAAGDCYLIYPGGASCIRFEKLREGIVDFEKIRILKEKVAGTIDKKSKNLFRELEEHLKVFATERDFDEEKLKTDVDKGGKLIEELSERLH